MGIPRTGEKLGLAPRKDGDHLKTKMMTSVPGLQPLTAPRPDVAVSDLDRTILDFQRLCGDLYRPQHLINAGISKMSQLPHGELKSFLAAGLSSDSLGAKTHRHELSLRASMFLFRKLLPSPPGQDPLPGYLHKLGQVPDISDDFVATMRKVVPKLFPKGWDRGWSAVVEGFVPTASACTERSKRAGGAREELLSMGLTRDLYIEKVQHGEIHIPHVRKVVVLEDGGKQRIVTIASVHQQFIAPLHTLLYNHLSRKEWLLRGDANAKSMSGMRSQEGEVFVSGDYEAATDNFNSSHSTILLGLIAQQSVYIPDAVWKAALLSLTGELQTSDGSLHPQVNGQMMGNYLSFPLLCLTNYLGVVHALGYRRVCEIVRAGGLKINGDDIVLRCTPAEKEKWFSAVSDAGLVLSKGKTMVHSRFFSLNSTFFFGTRKRVGLIPVLRSKTIYGFEPGRSLREVIALARSASSAWVDPSQKGFIQAEVLRKNSLPILGYHRQVPNPFTSLVRNGVVYSALWRRGVGCSKKFDAIRERECSILKSEPQLDKLAVTRRVGQGDDLVYLGESKIIPELLPGVWEAAMVRYQQMGWASMEEKRKIRTEFRWVKWAPPLQETVSNTKVFARWYPVQLSTKETQSEIKRFVNQSYVARRGEPLRGRKEERKVPVPKELVRHVVEAKGLPPVPEWRSRWRKGPVVASSTLDNQITKGPFSNTRADQNLLAWDIAANNALSRRSYRGHCAHTISDGSPQFEVPAGVCSFCGLKPSRPLPVGEEGVDLRDPGENC